VELDRSRVAFLQYETAVEQAKLQFEQAKTRLQLLIGRKTVSPDFDVTAEMRRESHDEPSEAILRRAVERRPDLAATKQAQARSRADLKLQLANGKVDYVVGTEYTLSACVRDGWQLARLVFQHASARVQQEPRRNSAR
jgi:cobalt-zinc-cadmium efflux system outer membrane protein